MLIGLKAARIALSIAAPRLLSPLQESYHLGDPTKDTLSTRVKSDPRPINPLESYPHPSCDTSLDPPHLLTHPPRLARDRLDRL